VEFDHVTIPVREYATSRRFYERLLAPLGFSVLLDWPDRHRAFLGLPGEPSSLWLRESETAGSLEISLAAVDADAVQAFHAAALTAGARSVEDPGIRPEFSREYYAARVLDPDGNSIEVVHRAATKSQALAA
jgi:catechol 2,3-dioxygenase-like lactoylglutathione lyase family enzyme